MILEFKVEPSETNKRRTTSVDPTTEEVDDKVDLPGVEETFMVRGAN